MFDLDSYYYIQLEGIAKAAISKSIRVTEEQRQHLEINGVRRSSTDMGQKPSTEKVTGVATTALSSGRPASSSRQSLTDLSLYEPPESISIKPNHVSHVTDTTVSRHPISTRHLAYASSSAHHQGATAQQSIQARTNTSATTRFSSTSPSGATDLKYRRQEDIRSTIQPGRTGMTKAENELHDLFPTKRHIVHSYQSQNTAVSMQGSGSRHTPSRREVGHVWSCPSRRACTCNFYQHSWTAKYCEDRQQDG